MYLQVTKAVRDALPSFESPEFVERLDVLFAEFYFQAFDAAAAQAWVSKAWAPLFARRDEQGILALQFAIAGMNAHINNDLAHALVLTWRRVRAARPARDSPEFRDYEKVNAILEARRGRHQGPALRRPDRERRHAARHHRRLPRAVEHPPGARGGLEAGPDHARDARRRAGLAVRRLRRLRRQPAAAPSVLLG